MYQLTHITRDRGSLTHDDRVDALAGAVARFTSTLALDVNDAAEGQREAELLQSLEDFAESFNSMGSPASGRTVLRGKHGEPVYSVRL
jgi:hypothetical protein